MQGNGIWQPLNMYVKVVAAFAGALALGYVGFACNGFDAYRCGGLQAVLRYIWICAGFVLAATSIRSPAKRFFAYGLVLVGSRVIGFLAICTQQGLIPDVSESFNYGTFLAVLALWGVGAIVWMAGVLRRRVGTSTGAEITREPKDEGN